MYEKMMSLHMQMNNSMQSCNKAKLFMHQIQSKTAIQFQYDMKIQCIFRHYTIYVYPMQAKVHVSFSANMSKFYDVIHFK